MNAYEHCSCSNINYFVFCDVCYFTARVLNSYSRPTLVLFNCRSCSLEYIAYCVMCRPRTHNTLLFLMFLADKFDLILFNIDVQTLRVELVVDESS